MEETKSPTVRFLSFSRWQVAPMESYLPILCMCTNVRLYFRQVSSTYMLFSVIFRNVDISPKKMSAFHQQLIYWIILDGAKRQTTFFRTLCAGSTDDRQTQTTTAAAVQRACYNQLATTLHDVLCCSQLLPSDPWIRHRG